MPDALIEKIRQIAEHVPTFDEYATNALGVLWRADDLALCLGVREPSLLERSRHWHLALIKIAAEVRAAAIVVAAGFKWGEPLPDSAEPQLQGLVKCRQDCPSPTYDNHYYVRVRDGRALIVHRAGIHGFDKHFWEWVAGTPKSEATE